MKPTLALLLCAGLCGCDNITDQPHRDFYVSATSNAMRFKSPPSGWTIMCDRRGHFVPAHGDLVFDLAKFVAPSDGYTEMTGSVRKDKREALIICWKMWEIDDYVEKHPFELPKVETVMSNTIWIKCP